MALRVLAISDSPFERSLLLSVLPSPQCAITLVDDASAATASLLGGAPDVVVTTTSFAVVVGRVFFERLTVPVLLLSRKADDDGARFSAAQVVVTAPFDRSKLLRAIEGLVAGESSSSPRLAPVAAAPDPHAERRARVDALFRQIAGLDHYALLGVARSAGPAEVVTAYRARLLEFHPDRLRDASDVVVQEQAAIITKRINSAFQTLTRPDLKRAYDAFLAGGAGPAPARTLDLTGTDDR